MSPLPKEACSRCDRPMRVIGSMVSTAAPDISFGCQLKRRGVFIAVYLTLKVIESEQWEREGVLIVLRGSLRNSEGKFSFRTDRLLSTQSRVC